MGVYLMITPYVYADEMNKSSPTAAGEDSLYRTVVSQMVRDRQEKSGFELFCAPDAEDGFRGLETYLTLTDTEDDRPFAELAERVLDIDSAMRYALLVQAMALSDNMSNNMFLWAHPERGSWRYRFALWDLDLSWDKDPGQNMDYWYTNTVLDRVIGLNVGRAREMLRGIWAGMRESGFTAECVEKKTEQYVHELGDSGAFARNVERWNAEQTEIDVYMIRACAENRFEMLDRLTGLLAGESGKIDFQNYTDKESRHVASMPDMIRALEASDFQPETEKDV